MNKDKQEGGRLMLDREKAIGLLTKDCIEASRRGDTWVFVRKDIVEDVLALLRKQEAKQGKWERQYSRPGVFANLFWWCSVCGQPTRYNDAGIFYQYCPRCGAKLEPCRDD